MWGTRGSIPVSGPRFARHGGNTACLEVRAGDDLVILDIMMPKVHGIDVLKTIRADGTKKDIGFIVCSARSFSVDLKSVRDLGAFDFLMKPFEIRSVLEKVEAFFAGRPGGR